MVTIQAMSGPTSLQRAAPSCCLNHPSSPHHYHYRPRPRPRHCHRHRHRRNLFHSPNSETLLIDDDDNDNDHEPLNKPQLTPLIHSNSSNEACPDTITRLSSFQRENEPNLARIDYQQTKHPIFMQHHKIDQTARFYAKTHSRTCNIDPNDQSSKRPSTYVNGIQLPDHRNRFFWLFDFSRLLTRPDRPYDPTLRTHHGGQRRFASNIFLLATAGALLALAIVAPPGKTQILHKSFFFFIIFY